MRLINATTFELKDFGAAPPQYAILSHTWGEEEVTFQDMADLDTARQKKGFAKIQQCCRQARHDGLSWAWVDTCCIDKTSSAELSETINSMFQWYGRAMKCYAFLEDVWVRRGDELFAGPDADASHEAPDQPSSGRHSSFFASRWWTRGWTLQELIAPYDVRFYNRNWEFLTRKRAYKQSISLFCGIAESVLDHSAPLSSICVAERISWASKRHTTREEDMAYCLLGILDVNMPLLYGEGGRKAFLRLQEHVVANNEDYTLFLWGMAPLPQSGPSASSVPFQSILASSPGDFGRDHVGQPWSQWSCVDRESKLFCLGDPPEITSRGLRVSLFIRPVTNRDLDDNVSGFSRLLQDYFRDILEPTDPVFVKALRPGGKLAAHTLFLGAFPFSDASPERRLPCILLLDVERFAYWVDADRNKSTIQGLGVDRQRPGTYARLVFFFHRLALTDLRIDNTWEAKTCFIKTRTDSMMRRVGLQLLHQPGASPILWDDLWIWQTPSFGIPFFHLHATAPTKLAQGELRSAGDGADEAWTRGCSLLQSTETLPGCVVSVAVRSGHYWLGARVSKQIGPSDLVLEAQQLATKDLSQMWVRTSKEVGPICEKRVLFGDRFLVITLWIERSGSWRAYLAFLEKHY